MIGAAASKMEQEPAMTVTTTKFGPIQVDPEKVLTLTTPFLGFPESRRFVLRPHGKDSPFIWLQSLDNPDLAFVTINPAVIAPAYRPDVLPLVREELAIGEARELELLVIITVPKGDFQAMTANLLGPVAINTARRLARQVLLDPQRYDPCWPVLKEE